METSRVLREVLIGDLALALELATAQGVAGAIQRCLTKRDGVGLPEFRYRRAIEEANRLIEEAGGDPRAAIGRRGGIARALHYELSLLDGDAAESLDAAGVGVRAPLRRIPDGRYIEFSPIAQGGMGVVYLALDTELNRRVAMKVVRPDRTGPVSSGETGPMDLLPPSGDKAASHTYQELSSRFLQEAWVTGGLEHPGIVPVYEIGETPTGIPCYTMRFVRGERTLSTACAEADTIEARLALLEPFLKVCDAVSYAHSRGVIHRDLKPENVALGEFGEAILLDWGLAKVKDRPDLPKRPWQERVREFRETEGLKTLAGGMGTPGYMSPEALFGAPDDIDERSDVYSLGAILYRILTGRTPQDCEKFNEYARALREEVRPAHEADAAVPEGLSQICGRTLAVAPAERIAEVTELSTAIRSWQAESAVEREVTGLLREARTAMKGAEGLAEEALLRQLGRVHGRATRIQELQPDHEEARSLVSKVEEARREALGQRERSVHRRLARRTAMAALCVAVVVAVVVGLLLDAKRREANRALLRARCLALVGASAAAQDVDLTRALLLAREAARITLNPDVLTRLHEAVSCAHERRQFVSGGKPITDAVFSPDGRRILTGDEDGTARIFDRAGRRIAVLEGHSAGINRCAFSPDGERILTASGDGTVRIWDSRGQQTAVLRGHVEGAGRASFSPDGVRILTVSKTGTVRIWDSDGRLRSVLRHPGKTWSASFSPDGTRILVSCFDGIARIWNVDGTPIAVLKGHGERLNRARYSRDGRRIVTASADGTARVWNSDGKELCILGGHSDGVWDACFSPDGERILTASLDCTARIWSVEGETIAVIRGHGAAIRTVRFSPGGERVLTASRDGTVRFWGARGRELAVLRGHSKQSSRVRFSPDGRHVITASRDGTARLWEVECGEAGVLRGHEGPVLAAAFSPDGSRVLTTSRDGTARLWNDEGEEVARLLDHGSEVHSAAFSPSGSLLLTSGRDHAARLWDRTGAPVAVLWGHDGLPGSAFFSPDGRRILTASEDGSARIWDLEGRQMAVLRGHEEPVYGASYSADGTRIVTASLDRTARIWDARGLEIAKIGGRGSEVLWAVFSPDGRTVLTAAGTGRVARLHDQKGAELAVFRGHGAEVWTAEFSPDGTRVLTASWDNIARLFDLQGNLITELRGHRGGLNAAVFSPDGRRIITSSEDGTARIWYAHTEDLLKLVDERIIRDFTPAEREQYAELLGEQP